jgi:hypothetical protein
MVKERIGSRISVEVLEELKKIARSRRVSMSLLVFHILEDYIQELGEVK